MEDNNVYRKKPNGRYEAIGFQYDRDWLGDGIWSVHHAEGSTSIRNLSHYGQIYKVGDIKYPDLSKLAGMLHFSDLVLNSDKVSELRRKSVSWDEIVNTILAESIRISEEIEIKSKKMPLRVINESNLKIDGFTKKGSTWTKRIDGTWYDVILKQQKGNSRYYNVIVETYYDHNKIAEFRAEFLHQIYQFVKVM